MQQARILHLPDKERTTMYRARRVRAATAYAKWAARKYAQNILKQLESAYGSKFEDFGGEQGIAKTMATYQVFEPLRAYAARVCIRLVKEKLNENSISRLA